MSTGSSAEIVTVGATRRELIVNLEDENGDPIKSAVIIQIRDGKQKFLQVVNP